jgi:DNA-binding NarL/FixJ family response regulator
VKARLLIADDHEVVRQGLREIFAATEDLEVVGEATDGEQAERLARDVPADLLILDIALPMRRGMQVLEALRAAGIALPVLFFSMYPAAQYGDYARRAGAQGFVGKDADSATLLQVVRRVLAGERSFAVADARGTTLEAEPDPFQGLSGRELEVMQGMLRGDSLQQIAQRMNIGSKSVSTYRSRLLIKLGLTSNVELAALAARKGYL